jgi:hypothetical protein
MRHQWGAAGALILGLSFVTPALAQQGGGGQAQPQADGCPADCPMHAEGGGCPAGCPHAGGEACECPGHGGKMGAHAMGCPMMKAKEAGVKAKVEETEYGAKIHLEGPRGDTKARDEARASARRMAKMMEEGCPHAMKAKKGTQGK